MKNMRRLDKKKRKQYVVDLFLQYLSAGHRVPQKRFLDPSAPFSIRIKMVGKVRKTSFGSKVAHSGIGFSLNTSSSFSSSSLCNSSSSPNVSISSKLPSITATSLSWTRTCSKIKIKFHNKSFSNIKTKCVEYCSPVCQTTIKVLEPSLSFALQPINTMLTIGIKGNGIN